jgi:hypothetical protein
MMPPQNRSRQDIVAGCSFTQALLGALAKLFGVVPGLVSFFQRIQILLFLKKNKQKDFYCPRSCPIHAV